MAYLHTMLAYPSKLRLKGALKRIYGDRLIVGTVMAGQVVMLDVRDRFNPEQLSVVSFGANAGPHNIVLNGDDSRLVVTDYFLNEDAAGIIHLEGDHKVHVLKVTHDTLIEENASIWTSTQPSKPAQLVPTELP